MTVRAALIQEAEAASERARQHLAKHHAARSWTEVMRDLKVTLDQCVAELKQVNEQSADLRDK